MHGNTYIHDGSTGWEKVSGPLGSSSATVGDPVVDRLLATNQAAIARGAVSLMGLNTPVADGRGFPCRRCIQCRKRNYPTCRSPVLSKSYRDAKLNLPSPAARAAAAHDVDIAELVRRVENSFSTVVEI